MLQWWRKATDGNSAHMLVCAHGYAVARNHDAGQQVRRIYAIFYRAAIEMPPLPADSIQSIERRNKVQILTRPNIMTRFVVS